jgi:hypothetical protein
MRALFKDNKRLIVRNLNKEDKILVNAFVDKFQEYEISLTELVDVDNKVDGITFTITDELRNKIHYKEPYIQVLMQKTTSTVDLETDEETNIEIINEFSDFLEVSVSGSVISVTAIEKPEFEGMSKHYVIYAKLTKPGCDQTTVPINISVIYITDKGVIDYEELENLPQINDVTVIGNKSLEEYGIQEEMDYITNTRIDDIINNIFN